MEENRIYDDIALRTDGNIYLGIVGPVRTGKSTFIKRFMETLVIPNIDNVYMKERAKDELPQSGSGRTIMTAEPKFVPEEAVTIAMDGGASFSVRMIDCVGYLVDGAIGQVENGEPRMVTTPWFDHEIPMGEAAEIGTRKVIAEHSTIGVVVTSDGTVTEIPRESYLEAEERVVRELKEIGKPFLVLLNSADPSTQEARQLRDELAQKYDVTCILVNCMELREEDITRIIKSVLYEFPVQEFGVFLPPWVDALSFDHPIKNQLFSAMRESVANMRRIKDVEETIRTLSQQENINYAAIREMNLGEGNITAVVELPRELFYETISQQSGFGVKDDGDLMSLLTEISKIKDEYDKIKGALEEVRTTGYGIVLPSKDELHLEEPEIVKQGGRYGVRLKASAPSIHIT